MNRRSEFLVADVSRVSLSSKQRERILQKRMLIWNVHRFSMQLLEKAVFVLPTIVQLSER